jgi:hypothetical protein
VYEDAVAKVLGGFWGWVGRSIRDDYQGIDDVWWLNSSLHQQFPIEMNGTQQIECDYRM